MSHSKPTDAQLENRFAYHAPVGDQVARYAAVRAACLEAAKKIRDLTPCSPEQTRALNSLHDAMMRANAAIACNEGSPTTPPESEMSPNEAVAEAARRGYAGR